jgi:hypothetical protein
MLQSTTEEYPLNNVQPNPQFNTKHEGTYLRELNAFALRRHFGEHTNAVWNRHVPVLSWIVAVNTFSRKDWTKS